MLYIRRQQDRGHANFGWLDSRHSFSFGQYYDPAHMGISNLRVINDDTVAGGAGFDTHGHRDMEIISYILEGTIEHRDSLGHQYLIPAGDVQVMTAGTGVMHSEFNHHHNQPLKFLQIWLLPDHAGREPGYRQATITQQGPLTALATPEGHGGSLTLHADASLYRLKLAASEQHTLQMQHSKRSGYLHLVEGSLMLDSGDVTTELHASDGAGSLDGQSLTVSAGKDGVHALWFDLAPSLH